MAIRYPRFFLPSGKLGFLALKITLVLQISKILINNISDISYQIYAYTVLAMPEIFPK